MKVVIFKYSILVAGLIIFIVQFSDWFMVGANTVFQKRFPVSEATFENPTHKYHVKEFKYTQDRHLLRFFTFYEENRFSFLEKKLDTYSVASGYENAEFSFKWNRMSDPAQVTVVGDQDTLWVLKEVRY